MPRRPPMLNLITAVSWVLRLPASTDITAGVTAGGELAEIPAADLELAFRGQALQPGSPDAVSRAVAGKRWRCFVLREGDSIVQHNFVSYGPRGPSLFRAETLPSHRGRGLFQVSIAEIARTLHEEGETQLRSSCSTANLPSMRAHTAAGFRALARSTDLYVRGRSMRRLLRQVLTSR